MTTSLENSNARLILKRGREKSLLRRHPWIFSGGIHQVDGDAEAGDIISVFDSRNQYLGKGYYNPRTQIRLRLLSTANEAIDETWFVERINAAIEARANILSRKTNACRLIHGEADGLPGLVVDRYADVLVIQFHAMGPSRHRDLLVDILKDSVKVKAILERTDSGSAKLEGLKTNVKWLAGKERKEVEIVENGVRFVVDLLKGQKTGFFLDQRDNRALIGSLAKGRSLLNCFSYSGGFSLYAAKAGAKTTSVDSSEPAMVLAARNFEANKIAMDVHRLITANVFDYLRESDELFDMIILDPPAFVKQRQQVHQGARGYNDINRLAMQKIAHGGLLMTCSCSAFVDWDLFGKIIFSSALEANRKVNIIGRYSQPADHPISVYFPEGEYLKTFLLRVTD